MSASPAQVANDLDAQAAFFAKREADLTQACRDCARAIRTMLNDGKIDGRTYGGVYQRMLNMDLRYRNRAETQISKSIRRGLWTLTEMHGQLVVSQGRLVRDRE